MGDRKKKTLAPVFNRADTRRTSSQPPAKPDASSIPSRLAKLAETACEAADAVRMLWPEGASDEGDELLKRVQAYESAGDDLHGAMAVDDGPNSEHVDAKARGMVQAGS